MAMMRGSLTFAAEADAKRLHVDADVTVEAPRERDAPADHRERTFRIPVIGGSGESASCPAWSPASTSKRWHSPEALKARG